MEGHGVKAGGSPGRVTVARFPEAAARLAAVVPSGAGLPAKEDSWGGGERPGAADVTEERLPRPDTAGYGPGRSPTRPLPHWAAPLASAGCWITVRARELRAAPVCRAVGFRV